MNKNQEKALKELINCMEAFESYRIIVDYAIDLCCEFSNKSDLNKEMTDYATKLFKRKDKLLKNK